MSGADPRPTEVAQERAVRIFSMTGLDSDNPRDHLTEVVHMLYVLARQFEEGAVDFSVAEASGTSMILRGCIETLESIDATIGTWVTNPLSATFQAGVKMLADEYRRGFADGESTAEEKICNLGVPGLANEMFKAYHPRLYASLMKTLQTHHRQVSEPAGTIAEENQHEEGHQEATEVPTHGQDSARAQRRGLARPADAGGRSRKQQGSQSVRVRSRAGRA